MMKKITVGFVVQDYDEHGNCVSSEFIGDSGQVEWENEMGDQIPAPPHNYFPLHMEQPHQTKTA